MPVVVASLPLVLGSMLLPVVLLPLAILPSMVLLYFSTLRTDPQMFALDRLHAYAVVTMPLCGLISLWGIGLASVERQAVMLGVVGPYALLLLLACAPAHRWRQDRTRRRIPLRLSFPAVGAVVLLGSFLHG